MKPTVYLETTIPSYLTARPTRDLVMSARQQLTREWWEKRRADFDGYISQLVLDECGAGDAEAAARRLTAVKGFPILDFTTEVIALASNLVDSHLIPEAAADDATHIALAATYGTDFLLTWNFAHIANAEKLVAIERACHDAGFVCPVICTPEALMEDAP